MPLLDLEVKYSRIISSKSLIRWHHTSQDPLVQSQRGYGSQKPAVTCVVGTEVYRFRHMCSLQQCKHPTPTGWRILSRDRNSLLLKITPSQCSTHHQHICLTQSPLANICPCCPSVNELWVRAKLL